MLILEINSYNFGSTGHVMAEIAEAARKLGMDCITSCPNGKSMREHKSEHQIFIGSRIGRNLHIVLSRWTGFNGCFSIVDTLRFLKYVRKLNPDIIHLHNLHNCYINLPLLFRFLEKQDIPVVWTLHDCWAFTGKCPHFDLINCEKWKTGCSNCPQLKEYPAAEIDKTNLMWQMKSKWFNKPRKMMIVTPSKWLENLVSKSFLSHHSICTIPNGIDLAVFQPTPSEFKQQFGIEGKYIILGVAFSWNTRKGLDIFIDLANRLDDRYKIVLVGTDAEIDALLPSSIVSIHRTQNQQELAKIYSAADVFINPTREETQGLVNVESLACGTPVITFRTGGSPECLSETCGCVVERDDIETLEEEIKRICQYKPYSKQDCRNAALLFDKNKCFGQYCDLYEELYEKYQEENDIR